MTRSSFVTLVLISMLVVAGCSQSPASSGTRTGELQRLAAERLAERTPPAGAPRVALPLAAGLEPARLLSAPTIDPTEPTKTDSPAADGQTAPDGKTAAPDGKSVAPTPVMGDRWWQKPLAGRSLGEVIKDDAKTILPELWKSTTDSATGGNFVLLGLAGGLSVVSRGSWDHRIDNSFMKRQNSIFHKERDFGSIAGSPTLHFGLAMAGYGLGVQMQNDELYGFSKTALQALMLNGMVTQGLKWATNDYSPNGERWAWPSGHTSSTAALAGVVWEQYGWQAGVPMYLLTGWVATTRLNDREHWMSDVIFGAVLGSVVGHSVARGRALEVGGFTVLPWIHPEGGAGLAFAKQF